MPLILFSGILYDPSHIPVYLKWIADLSIVRMGFNATVLTQLGTQSAESGELMLNFLGISRDEMASDVTNMVLITFAFFVFSYVVLQTRLYFSIESY